MDWKQIIENRHQCFVFKDIAPEKTIIDQILNEMHTKCPSKQNRVIYKLHVLDWADTQLRLDLYKGTERDSKNFPRLRNPQVLAPYLFIWTKRTLEDKIDIHTGGYLNPEYSDQNIFDQQLHMEVGISSIFVNLSAVEKGLSCGFCKCIHNHDEVNKKYGIDPILYLGVGFKKDSSTFFCPIEQKELNVPSSKWYDKPMVDQYIHYSV